MWLRRTFYECAGELEQMSRRFRTAFVSNNSDRQQVLTETSIQGVQILQSLSLTIRSEQDFDLVPRTTAIVGAEMATASPTQVQSVLLASGPGRQRLSSPMDLVLRDALNKIAHADGRRSSFFASDSEHDIILVGELGSRTWIAVISIPAFCTAVYALPDAPITA